MARGLTREQIGVSEEMIETFGDTIFRMSHNYQERVGDPIRELNWEEIERQKENLGLADGQIAERIGMTREQVMFIRTIMERRRFRTGHYARLLELGGGRRFRADRFTPHLDRFAYDEEAIALRGAMVFRPEAAKKFVSEGWWRDDTLPKWLDRHAGERPDAPAIAAGDTTLSYGELAEQVETLARAIYGAGVKKGDVVALQLPNIPEFLIAYLAIARIGAVLMTIHMPYRAAEIETLVNHAQARAVICLSETKDWSPAGTIAGMRAKLPSVRQVIALGKPVEGALSLSDMMASSLDEELPDPPVASDPFLMMFTSGTTAAPKCVVHPSHTMLSNARVGAPEHTIGPDDRVISAAPFSHLFGLYSFHVALAAGACSVLLPVFTPPDLAAAIENGKPTGLWTAPAHMAAMQGMGLFDKHDLSSLKMMIMSGSACPPDLVRWVANALPNCAVTQLWGMTETQGALYSRPGDSLDVAATSAGRPSPGTEVRVVDLEGNVVPTGEEGELQVRGSLLFPGYFKNDAANRDSFTEDGWYKSGDLATEDADGNVAITGRIKDVINRGGVKFNPRDIEDLLDGHAKVAQSAIVPMPDPVLGERACAFVTLAPGADTVSLEELCDHLMERKIAKNKLPEKLVVVDEMPLTPTRKIIKGKLVIPADD